MHSIGFMAESATGQSIEEQSVYDVIGFSGLAYIIWKSAPFRLGLATPYGLIVYYNILKHSSNLDDVLSGHSDYYINSRAFRLLRPRYHKLKKLLVDRYRIE